MSRKLSLAGFHTPLYLAVYELTLVVIRSFETEEIGNRFTMFVEEEGDEIKASDLLSGDADGELIEKQT